MGFSPRGLVFEDGRDRLLSRFAGGEQADRAPEQLREEWRRVGIGKNVFSARGPKPTLYTLARHPAQLVEILRRQLLAVEVLLDEAAAGAGHPGGRVGVAAERLDRPEELV